MTIGTQTAKTFSERQGTMTKMNWQLGHGKDQMGGDRYGERWRGVLVDPLR
jgi:hypothetical protein